MEITKKLQPVKDKAYHLFTEVEGQGEKQEQVVTTVERHLEGPINDAIIHKFVEKEVLA